MGEWVGDPHRGLSDKDTTMLARLGWVEQEAIVSTSEERTQLLTVGMTKGPHQSSANLQGLVGPLPRILW